jgi:hypothetical protein
MNRGGDHGGACENDAAAIEQGVGFLRHDGVSVLRIVEPKCGSARRAVVALTRT